MKFNKYWIIVFGITIVNIFIFSTFSKKLETYVYDGMVENDQNLMDSLNKSNVAKDIIKTDEDKMKDENSDLLN